LPSSSAPQAAKTADSNTSKKGYISFFIKYSPSVTLKWLIHLTKESYRGHYKAYFLKKIAYSLKWGKCNVNVIYFQTN
jgi:hypothetical protein